jgi:hypothetical protein
VRVHLRGAAGEIDDLSAQFVAMRIDPVEDLAHRFPGHDLRAVRAGLDVAMVTREVAQLAEVELKGADRSPRKRLPVRGEALGESVRRLFGNRK